MRGGGRGLRSDELDMKSKPMSIEARDERRAAPGPARIPSRHRGTYSFYEGLH
jgi:hypothetical protein